MTNVHEWAVAAGDNNGTPPAGAPENMQPGKVNDTVREIMAAVARWYQDQRMGSLVTAGSGNAYTLTSNQTYAALSDIGLISVRVDRANTGAATLNVDSLGAKSWYKRPGSVEYASGDLVADQTVVVAYNATDDAFETVGGHSGDIDSGSSMIKFDAAADNGWTKDTTANLDDTAIRLVTGTPGSRTDQSGLSTVFGITSTDNHSLSEAQLASHDHTDGSLDVANHDHDMGLDVDGLNFSPIGGSGDVQNGGGDDTGNTSPDVTGSTANAGGGSGHDHDIDLRANYHDVIKQDKD